MGFPERRLKVYKNRVGQHNLRPGNKYRTNVGRRAKKKLCARRAKKRELGGGKMVETGASLRKK